MRVSHSQSGWLRRYRSVARGALLALPLAVVLTLTTTTAATAAPQMAPLLAASPNAVANEYIVVLRSDTNLRSAASERQQVRREAAAEGGSVMFDYGTALNGFAARLPAEALEAVRRNPAVDYIQPNDIHQQTSGPAPTDQLPGPAPTAVQSNPPWHLDRIDQRYLPLNNQYVYTNQGQGVHAYILDSGIRSTHDEIDGRVVSAYTSIFDGNGTEDCHNHGTFVASEVGGQTYGVAKQVTLHSVRVLNCSASGSTAEIVAGMDWVADNHQNPNVANMSIQSAGGYTNVAMDQAAAGMIDAGVNLVLIVGNFDNNDCTNSPKDPRALIVGATTINDARNTIWNSSSYGPCVDVWAPGADITGAGSGSDSQVLTNWYGTSMAAPLVAGTIAMALESHPGMTMQQAHDLITDNATQWVLSDLGNSPNRLLYSQALTPTP